MRTSSSGGAGGTGGAGGAGGAGLGAVATSAPEPLRLRVTVGDTWLPMAIDAAPGETVAQVKSRVLAASRIDASRAAEYEMKHGGALLADESQSLAAAGVRTGTALIVLARRRRPVR